MTKQNLMESPNRINIIPDNAFNKLKMDFLPQFSFNNKGVLGIKVLNKYVIKESSLNKLFP